ncbi:YqgE/AlgH family protein [Pseudooceanicola nanhaiensis]|uniref:YqgE/AlgH family protein n=1 Tax=Pseudooceanicola nanhaiensis TaxID=375761 RepID=UPI00296FB6EF|nr:YqgE/AlgH family protein [Pseudooceanicola nanhaiensis]
MTGQLLIAMPGLRDERFERGVILLCAHSGDGAMGLMVNHPSRDVRLSDMLEQLNIDKPGLEDDLIVYAGGPVEPERGFVLHSADYSSVLSTINVRSGICLTATRDILEDVAGGNGPLETMVALGYCGWGPGQLERELSENGWLLGEASAELVFHAPDERKWDLSMQAQGISPLNLSGQAGHA